MTFVVYTKNQHKPKTPQPATSQFAIVCATCGETQYFGSDQANAMLTAREIHMIDCWLHDCRCYRLFPMPVEPKLRRKMRDMEGWWEISQYNGIKFENSGLPLETAAK